MNILRPSPDCPLTCAFRNTDQCVCNLISVSGEKAPISYGLHIGLGNFYGSQSLPPCVHGPLGSAYWSVGGGAANALQPGEPDTLVNAKK